MIKTRNNALASRLREVFLDGRWIANTNYKEQLLGLSREQAVHRIGRLNSIAMLTYHINYYLSGLLDAFENGELKISDKYSFDAGEINSEDEWKKLQGDLLINAEKFAVRVKQFEEQHFDQPFIDAKYGTLLRNIEGVLEHSYYHLGQITLIRKMIEEMPDKS